MSGIPVPAGPHCRVGVLYRAGASVQKPVKSPVLRRDLRYSVDPESTLAGLDDAGNHTHRLLVALIGRQLRAAGGLLAVHANEAQV